MTVLFTPQLINFSSNVAAGSGTVTQVTYTVPAGKRATIKHAFIGVTNNTAAANTVAGRILVSIGGAVVSIAFSTGLAGIAVSRFDTYTFSDIDLRAGDTVSIQTINTSAVIIFFTINCIMREYL